MSGGGGGEMTPEQKKLQSLQLQEFEKVKQDERRRVQALNRSRSGKVSLMSGAATGIPNMKQSTATPTLSGL